MKAPITNARKRARSVSPLPVTKRRLRTHRRYGSAPLSTIFHTGYHDHCLISKGHFMTTSDAGLRTFAGLRRIVAQLRSPDGCPWDKVQTHQSLRPFLLEESSEVLSALDSADPSRFVEELGDLLFQVLIHIQIAEEQQEFRLGDVIES